MKDFLLVFRNDYSKQPKAFSPLLVIQKKHHAFVECCEMALQPGKAPTKSTLGTP